MTRPLEAAIGFRAHTGWAVAVALAGPPEAPRVVLRQRLKIADADSTEGAQVFHRAEPLEPAAAEKLVGEATVISRKLAAAAVGALVAELRGAGWTVVRSGIVGSPARLPPTLAQILASHAFVHSAEGDLYRSVLIAASEAAGIPTVAVAAKDLWNRAAKSAGARVATFRDRIAAMGRGISKPWGSDEKEATAAAWVALRGDRAAESRRRTRR